MTEQATTIDELAFTRPYGEQEKQILTAEAVEFLTELVTHFTPQRNKLLAARIQQQQDIDNGRLPDFISETASIRDADWKIRGIPADLEDRRVEITGPVEQDGDQRAQRQCESLYGRFRRFTGTRLEQSDRWAN